MIRKRTCSHGGDVRDTQRQWGNKNAKRRTKRHLVLINEGKSVETSLSQNSNPSKIGPFLQLY